MKAITKSLLTLSTFLMVLSGCKKGDGDPFFTLQSRKARLAGEWMISEWTEESTSNTTEDYFGNVGEVVSTNNFILQEDRVEWTSTRSDGFLNQEEMITGPVETTFNIEKGGTFTRTIKLPEYGKTTVTTRNYSTPWVETTVEVQNQTTTVSGTWNFLGGIEDDYKNKERIILNILERTSEFNDQSGMGEYSETAIETFENGELNEVWAIESLRSKEAILHSEGGGTTSQTNLSNYLGVEGTLITNSETIGNSRMVILQ